ncbi:MAG: hypothetical protein ABIQ03_08035 [Burkholderiales bacterium]
MPSAVLIRALELQHDLASAVALEPFVGNGRAGNIPTQVFEFLALIGAAAHCGMQAEAVRVGAQGFAGWRWSAGHGLQAQHFPPCAGPTCDAVGAGGHLQRRDRAIRIGVARVDHPLFFDAVTAAANI